MHRQARTVFRSLHLIANPQADVVRTKNDRRQIVDDHADFNDCCIGERICHLQTYSISKE